ncbi:MAG: hypothetical protein GY820_23955 [Gammaproteobacteria bacterium]|nr:hypothetical protein [Gammaproteobacteria bacterium]
MCRYERRSVEDKSGKWKTRKLCQLWREALLKGRLDRQEQQALTHQRDQDNAYFAQPNNSEMPQNLRVNEYSMCEAPLSLPHQDF